MLILNTESKSMKSLLAYKLKPDEREQHFREEHYIKDRKHTVYLLLIAITVITGYIFLDSYLLKNHTLSLYITLISRAVTIISLFSGIILLYRTKRKYFDLIIFIIALIVALHVMVVNYLRPSNHVAIVAWDFMVIFGIYATVPFLLTYQIISSVFLSVGTNILWLYVTTSVWSEAETLPILGGYLSANIFGIFLSLQLKRSRRQQYQILKKEREARQGLEKAQKEVKILQGILPICSFCKKIRNDEGYYEKVEAYITRYSEADFSHTVCPDCMKMHYPDYLKI